MEFPRAPETIPNEIIVPRPVRPVLYYILVPAGPLATGKVIGLAELARVNDRQFKIEKYRRKRVNRRYISPIKYRCRQEQAAKRPRIKGQFVKDVESISRKTTEDEEILAEAIENI